MKLIAKKDFANVPALGLKLNATDTKGFVHELHVHKGHRFTIGSTDIFEDLKPSEKDIVAQLVGSKSAIYDVDANKAQIAKIEAEVAADAKQAATVSKPASLPELIAAAVKAALTPAAKSV